MNLNISNIFPAIFKGLNELELNPLTLAFTDGNKTLEKEFITSYFKEKLFQIRAAIIIGIILYSLFGILDAFSLDDLKYTFWFIRFGVVVPFSLVIFTITYSKFFKKWNQLIIMMPNLVGGIAIIVMILLAGPPVSYSYYAGLILILIYLYTFSGLRFVWAAGTCWGLVVAFEILAIFFKDIPTAILISNNFFFVASNVLAMFAAYSIEFSLRKDFYLTRLLNAEKEKVGDSKRHLEGLVKERTVQLIESNKELSDELIKKRELLDEQKKLQEQLIQSQKMEAIGQLAGGIAHDFNNLLTVINGYSELLLLSTPKKEASFKSLKQINDAGKRAKSLTQQLLAFSRKQILQPVVIDLNQFLKELKIMLQRLIGENIELVFKFDSGIYKIEADPGQLGQVIMNLIVNARDAMPKGGRIIIETQNKVSNIHENQSKENFDPSSEVLLKIIDTGIGMDDELSSKIFDPFFTTKGKGTGLGLSTVYGIIKQSNASIHVDSKKGEGTSFSMYFNAVKTNEQGKIEKSIDHQNLFGKETILVVEDEEAVREYIGVILNKYGYDVLLMSDGNKALDIFKKNMEEIDLLITDVIMPIMSGKEMIDKMQKYKPELKYIYISGYTDDIIGEHGILDKETCILQKPFTHSTLMEKIRFKLD